MKPLACLTISRNERHFLPIWLRHYGAAGGDLVLLDHENDPQELLNAQDECVANGFPLTILPVSNPRSDDVHWMRATVEATVDDLLREYRTVVFAEVDELLIPDPFHWPADEYGTGLEAVLRLKPQDRYTFTGYEVLPDGRWVTDERYDKTLVVRKPTRWEVGFHRPTECVRPAPDPNLVLLHLHYRNREVAWDRLQARQRGKTVVHDGLGSQNKFTSRIEFDRHFDDAVSRPPEPIPERFLPFLS